MNDSRQSQMYFEANRKSAGVAYLLWLFLGGLGAHRFYLGQTGTGAAQLMLALLGWLPLFLGWAVLGIWLLVDLFLIPGIARDENMKTIDRINQPQQPWRPADTHPRQLTRPIDSPHADRIDELRAMSRRYDRR